MSKKIIFILLLTIGIVAISASFLLKNNVVPKVEANDQPVLDGQVIIAEVVASAPSWLVIQTETNGTPGPVIGYAKIVKGSNKNVSVKIDTQKITPKLFAMIHEDDGIKNQFDFPNNDMPLLYKEEMVSKLFTINK